MNSLTFDIIREFTDIEFTCPKINKVNIAKINKIKMKKCAICGGELKHKKVDIPALLKDKLLMIREVPADVCCECEEIYYPLKVARKLEAIEDKVIHGTLKPSPMKNAYELPLPA